uniref:Uncharacterized protein n=1 Tax=Picea glauca TaxID=3330 RepID=A0A101LY74_PICGL|nr:hypothetical protein ABT39_MTgene5700 [Picea glauca]QHR90634.1 hypothetical protein Q903MT_gene4659 [Picea sitchensis]
MITSMSLLHSRNTAKFHHGYRLPSQKPKRKTRHWHAACTPSIKRKDLPPRHYWNTPPRPVVIL